ncbi:hypothetical protein ACJX0J_007726 [Zea mays]
MHNEYCHITVDIAPKMKILSIAINAWLLQGELVRAPAHDICQGNLSYLPKTHIWLENYIVPLFAVQMNDHMARNKTYYCLVMHYNWPRLIYETVSTGTLLVAVNGFPLGMKMNGNSQELQKRKQYQTQIIDKKHLIKKLYVFADKERKHNILQKATKFTDKHVHINWK